METNLAHHPGRALSDSPFSSKRSTRKHPKRTWREDDVLVVRIYLVQAFYGAPDFTREIVSVRFVLAFGQWETVPAIGALVWSVFHSLHLISTVSLQMCDWFLESNHFWIRYCWRYRSRTSSAIYRCWRLADPRTSSSVSMLVDVIWSHYAFAKVLISLLCWPKCHLQSNVDGYYV